MCADSPALAIVSHAGLALSAGRAVAQAAEAAALAEDCRMCIAIIDGGGHLQHFVRRDGTHIASIEVAIAKARCALAFRRPTKAFGGTPQLDGEVGRAGADILLTEGEDA